MRAGALGQRGQEVGDPQQRGEQEGLGRLDLPQGRRAKEANIVCQRTHAQVAMPPMGGGPAPLQLQGQAHFFLVGATCTVLVYMCRAVSRRW